jgi:hypothetical protein
MTVPSTTRRAGPFSGNDVATAFPFTFKVFAASDLRVAAIVDDIETVLTLDSNYSVALNADQDASPGGTITYPISGTPLATGDSLTIIGQLPYDQMAELPDGGSFSPRVIANALDRATMQIQQLVDQLGQTVRASEINGLDALPGIETRASKLLGFDASGQPVALVGAEADSATALQLDLADSTSATKGAALVALNNEKAYTSGTVGFALRSHGLVLQDADPTGSVDATPYLKALFDYCIPRGLRAVIPAGTYKVTGPITEGGAGAASQIAAGSLHIVCAGDVVLEVLSSATHFQRVITCYTTAINSASVSGGRLTINCNNKAACGLYIRHLGTQGGTIDLGPVEVNDAFDETTPTPVMEVCAIQISGRYTLVKLASPRVVNVDRTVAGGVCKGISVSELDGPCEITSPYIEGVLAGPGTGDADGIAVFGYASGGAYGSKNGYARILNPVIVDCAGRALKFQLTDVFVDRPSIYRQMVVSLNLAEIDFQGGGECVVMQPYIEYRKNGATSPLHADFYVFALQANCTDRPNRFTIKGGTIRSEVSFSKVASLLQAATALNTVVNFDDIEIQPLGTATVAVSRAFIDVEVGQVQASSATSVHVGVRNCRANISGFPWIGSTGATSVTASTFSFSCVGNENLGAVDAGTRALLNLSGSTVTTFAKFMIRDNVNTIDYMGTLIFDYQALPVGCRFHYDLATGTDTNAPGSLGASGTAFVEVLGLAWHTSAYRTVRVSRGNADTATTVFHTQTGAAWGALN